MTVVGERRRDWEVFPVEEALGSDRVFLKQLDRSAWKKHNVFLPIESLLLRKLLDARLYSQRARAAHMKRISFHSAVVTAALSSTLIMHCGSYRMPHCLGLFAFTCVTCMYGRTLTC